MRTGISVSVTPADGDRLRSLVKDRNVPQKHVWRAQIVLLSAEGVGTNAIMRETGKSKTCVWRWQERFAAEGVDGLLRDKTRGKVNSGKNTGPSGRAGGLCPAKRNVGLNWTPFVGPRDVGFKV